MASFLAQGLPEPWTRPLIRSLIWPLKWWDFTPCGPISPIPCKNTYSTADGTSWSFDIYLVLNPLLQFQVFCQCDNHTCAGGSLFGRCAGGGSVFGGHSGGPWAFPGRGPMGGGATSHSLPLCSHIRRRRGNLLGSQVNPFSLLDSFSPAWSILRRTDSRLAGIPDQLHSTRIKTFSRRIEDPETLKKMHGAFSDLFQ